MVADAASRDLTDAGPRPGAGAAEVRITRLSARFIAIGYLAYLAILAPRFLSEAMVLDTWWAVLGPVVVFAPPMVFGVATFRDDLGATRLWAKIAVFGYIAAALTWPLAWNGGLLGNDVWISQMPGLAGLAAALVWPPRYTVLALAAAVVPVQFINHYGRIPTRNALLIPDILFAASFCLLFVAAQLMAIRTGRLLDETRATTHAAASAAASAQARRVQRDRFNALLHDWVMSTLLAVTRRPTPEQVNEQARRTLDQLDALDNADVAVFDRSAMLAHFRTAVTAVDGSVPFQIRQQGDIFATAVYPAEPVRVIGAAAAEAVRNSVRHAGRAARCEVTVTVTPERVSVVITDDGVGFDPVAVPAHRLGVAVSILARVRALDGGAVSVLSKPGFGTIVRMSWMVPA